MNYTARLTSLFLGSALLAATSCQKLAPIDAEIAPTRLTLPASIDYHAEGTLAHLVYRSLFTYNAANQLVSVRDSLLAASPGNQPVNQWVRFAYDNNRLSAISIDALSDDRDSDSYGQAKPGRFELAYTGQTINARLVIGGQTVKTASFAVDQQGYPLKTNVSLGQLFLDSRGNLDAAAESSWNKARNPNNFSEVVNQQYDPHQNVFAQSKEYQILTALLAVFNRGVFSSGLVGLDNALTTNNLLSRTIKHCTALYGCNTYTLVSETQQVNERGFPTQRNAPLGAMGNFQYTITYK